MSDTPPYSEATVELVAAAIASARDDDVFTEVEWNGSHWDGLRDAYRSDATSALDALAAAGRLLPEGALTAAEALMAARDDLNGVAKRLRAKAVETGDKEHFGLQAAGVQLACFRLVELADKAGESAVPPEPKEGTDA